VARGVRIQVHCKHPLFVSFKILIKYKGLLRLKAQVADWFCQIPNQVAFGIKNRYNLT
jgi:hypothetical protein